MFVKGSELKTVLEQELAAVEIVDVHTHLFPPEFAGMLLWGIDEILTYHYLVAEYFRYSSLPYEQFFKLPKKEQAALVWKTLFVEGSPLSEAQRGVLTILQRLGLEPEAGSLDAYRGYFRSLTVEQQVDQVFKLAGLKEVVMTNDPFDPQEREYWKRGKPKDPRFKAALRIDPLLLDYPRAAQLLQAEGYQVEVDFSGSSAAEVRRFLEEWIRRTEALYLAASLPPTFQVSVGSLGTRMLKECILPICGEHGLPFAPMIGVKRLVNKGLGPAGDSVGKGEIEVVEQLCTEYPDHKFLVTMLSRENQHELAVTARKYRNLLVFGCWWFLNNPSLVKEITALRVETLGLSFIPQHSDARVLEHLVYKWEHSKQVIGQVLEEKYADLLTTGWKLKREQIRSDLERLLQTNFHHFLAGKKGLA